MLNKMKEEQQVFWKCMALFNGIMKLLQTQMKHKIIRVSGGWQGDTFLELVSAGHMTLALNTVVHAVLLQNVIDMIQLESYYCFVIN
jgi:hypothetical protein